MKAIILADDMNNEIKGIVGDIPKCLAEVDNSNILEMQLDVLHSCCIDDVSVVRGYKSHLINIPGIKYYENDDYENTGILYSLFCAENELEGDTLILYGDIVYSKNIINRILESKDHISLGVMVNLEDHNELVQELELVHFNSENSVIKIGKNLNKEDIAFGQFSGIIKCNQKGIKILKNNYDKYKKSNPHYKNSLIIDLFDEMVSIGIELQCVIFEKEWLKINCELDYNKLQKAEFIKITTKTRTDWQLRSKTYDNIQWVNNNESIDVMVEFGQIKENANVLDVGTGTGKVLKTFKEKYPTANYYGIDISYDMMSKIDKSNDFNLQVANVENLDIFDDNFFDLVTARMSIHHVNNLKKASCEVYDKLKSGGKFIICEGVSPNKETLSFYKEVFRYKEIRTSFLVDDLINLMVDANFQKIMTRTIILKKMSMNNWLENGGIPFRNIDIISKLHYDCSSSIRKAYNMEFTNNDVLMDWKFVVVVGTKS